MGAGGVDAATDGISRFSRAVAGGQAQLAVLSCSNEEEWDGGRAAWSPAMLHSRHQMGGTFCRLVRSLLILS